MITASAALRTSLPAVVQPSCPILVTSPLNNRPVTRHLGIGNVQLLPREQKTRTLLQLAANRLPLFSSTYNLFFQAFTPDFLCFHPLPDSFLQNRGVGASMANFLSAQKEALKGREPRTAWGEADPGLGG